MRPASRLARLRHRLRPKGFQFSFSGCVFGLFTGTMVFLAIRFPQFKGLVVVASAFLLVNALFFVRFRDRDAIGWFDRMMASRFFPRKLTFAPEGKFLVIISIGIGFAAVNTGSNLLYLLMAMLMAIIVASGILSELTLRNLSWSTDIPSQAVARTETVMPIRVTNGKRRLNSFSLDGDFLFPDDQRVEHHLGRVLKLAPGAGDWLFPRLVFPRRGVYRVRGIALGTRYPFSFFRKSRHYEAAREVTVVPRGDKPVPPLVWGITLGREEHANRRGRGSEFFSVRSMAAGDDWRDVHWKQTARTGRFAIREFEALASRRVWVLLGMGGSTRVSPTPPAGHAEAGQHWRGYVVAPPARERAEVGTAEEGIELAASIARHLVGNGFEVGLSAPGAHVRPAGGTGGLREIFLALALLDLTQGWVPGEWRLPPERTDRDILLRVTLDDEDVQIGGVS